MLGQMDFVSDNNPIGVWRADRLVGAPDYVNNAPVVSSDEVDALPAVAFADARRRELPIHTKAATWLSAAYFLGADRRDVAIETALTKAAAGHGISEDLARLRQAFATDTEKQASSPAEPCFALKGDFGDHLPGGRYQAFYPINTPIEVIQSGVQLAEDARRMPIELFHEASRAVVKAAAALGVPRHELHDSVLKAGTERLIDFVEAERHARLRCSVVEDESARALYHDILKSAAADDEKNVGQYIDLWADLDRTHQVNYGNGILPPYEAFHSGMTRSAFDKIAAASVVVHDVVVPRSVFNAVKPADIDLHFPKSAAEVIKPIIQARAEPAESISQRVAALAPEAQRELLRLLVKSED